MVLEDVVDDVAEPVRTGRAGLVVAVWADGRVTVEGLGFYGHRRDDGSWSVPVASFPTLKPIAREEVHARLLLGLKRHGLLA